MKNELISNVSHDLKTPLTSIITYVDLLKQENITKEEQNKYINTIDKKAQRLKSLIEDLFEVSKANSGNIKLNLMDIDIVALIKQTEFELEDKIKESGLKFKNTFPKEKIILSLDSEKTYRIFENLIINALKYSLKGSRVYIVIEENNEEVSIVFKNISAEEIDFNPEEISERFVRGDKSRNTEGAGLGLAIAKSFTEVQKGNFKIEVDGDLFKVILKFKKNNNFVKEEEALDFKKAIL
ncbi:MAG: sensor histidine kinase [Clostridium sp.]